MEKLDKTPKIDFLTCKKHLTGQHRRLLNSHPLRYGIVVIVAILTFVSQASGAHPRQCLASKKTMHFVQRCPQNEKEWKEAVRLKNCQSVQQNCSSSELFQYHCLIEETRLKLVEVCAPTIFVIGSSCAEYNTIANVIQSRYEYSCGSFTPRCPFRYRSHETYKYQSCYSFLKQETTYANDNKTTFIKVKMTTDFEIINGIGERTSPLSTSNATAPLTDSNEDVRIIYFVLSSILGFIILTIVLVVMFHRKKTKLGCGTVSEEVSLLQPNQTCSTLGDIEMEEKTCLLQQKALVNPSEGMREIPILKEWEKEDAFFFRTRACEEGERILKATNILNIIGNSGSGKTAIAKHIALRYQTAGFKTIPVNSFENIKNEMNPNEKQIFVLNDPVGKESLDDMLDKKVKMYEDSTLNLLTDSNIKLIFTCRKDIANDKSLRCKLLTLSIVDIDGEKLCLSKHEKKSVLEKHADLSKIDYNEISEILTRERYFPLLCFLYGNNEKYKEKGSAFFKGFDDIIEEEILHFTNSDKGKFTALVLLSVYENGLEEKQLTEPRGNCSKIVQKIFKLCDFKGDKPMLFLLKQLSILEGSYVKKVGTLFMFLHDYMMKLTTFMIGKYTIQQCPGRWLQKHLVFKKTELNVMGEKSEDFEIKLDEMHAPFLVERFISEIKKGNCIDPFLSPCFRHKSVITGFVSNIDISLRQELLTPRAHDRKSLNLNKIKESFTKLDFLFWKNKASPLHLLVIHNFDLIVRNICEKVDNSELRKYELLPASCASGNTALVEYFIDRLGVKPHEKWNDDLDPLQIAAIFNYDDIINVLLQRGISDINCNLDEYSPLMLASLLRFDNMQKQNITVMTLINNKADISLCNGNGDSALHCAAMNGHDSVVKILLDNKADVNLCNNTGGSPLYQAAEKGYDSVVKILLDNQAKINMRDQDSKSPLYMAALNGHDSVVKTLVNYNADVNIRDNDGVSPLFIASERGHHYVVKLLLENDVLLNMCNNNGVSPLYIAAQNGHDSVVEILLNSNADINLGIKNGSSPLYIAAKKGHDSIVKILLDNNADVNMCDKDSKGPLQIAKQEGHGSIVKILLEKCADVNFCKHGSKLINMPERHRHDSV